MITNKSSSTASGIVLDDEGNIIECYPLTDTLRFDVIFLIADEDCILLHGPPVMLAERSDLQIFDGVVVKDLLQQRSADVLVCHFEDGSDEIFNALSETCDTFDEFRVAVQLLPEHLEFTCFQ